MVRIKLPFVRFPSALVATLASVRTQIRWCSPERFASENDISAAPGRYLNRFGWSVIGTTIGGNAIVVRPGDPAIYFADHTWYGEDGAHYQDLKGDRSWISAPLNETTVERSLFRLAESASEFVRAAEALAIDRLIDEID